MQISYWSPTDDGMSFASRTLLVTRRVTMVNYTKGDMNTCALVEASYRNLFR